MPENPISIADLRCGRGAPLLVIAGPCVLETETLTLTIAQQLRRIADELTRTVAEMKRLAD